jgi:hypothetical protein
MDRELLQRLFRCPEPPIGELPFWTRLAPGVRATFTKAWELCYFSGVKDGVFAGVIGTLVGVACVLALLATIFYAIRRAEG